MPQAPNTEVREVNGEYVGTENALYGKVARVLVQVDDNGDPNTETVKAQFRDKTVGERAFGWHEFQRTQFELDTFAQS